MFPPSTHCLFSWTWDETKLAIEKACYGGGSDSMYWNIYCDNQQLNVRDDVIFRDPETRKLIPAWNWHFTVWTAGILETWEHFRLSPNIAYMKSARNYEKDVNIEIEFRETKVAFWQKC